MRLAFEDSDRDEALGASSARARDHLRDLDRLRGERAGTDLDAVLTVLPEPPNIATPVGAKPTPRSTGMPRTLISPFSPHRVQATCDDGTHVIGFAARMLPPRGLVLERPAFSPDESRHVELDLARVSILKVILPGETVRLFCS